MYIEHHLSQINYNIFFNFFVISACSPNEGDSNDLSGVFRLEGIHLNSGKKVSLLVDSNTKKSI